MSQANHANSTTLRPHARPGAIFPTEVYSSEATRLSFANLRDNLAAIDPPPMIGLAAYAADIEAAANHAEQVLGAVTSYIKGLVGDTAWRAPCDIHDETGLLADAAADIVGELRNSAEGLRLEGGWQPWQLNEGVRR